VRDVKKASWIITGPVCCLPAAARAWEDNKKVRPSVRNQNIRSVNKQSVAVLKDLKEMDQN
jgi:hypothetical protein